MEPLGDGIGKSLNKNRRMILPIIICFVLGFFITVSEPDLQVLAEQVPTIPNATLICCVGIGTKDKDIVISLGAESAVKALMANFGTTFESHSKYGGLMIVLKISAANRILTEILSYNLDKNSEKGNDSMKNEHHNNLIVISINEGFSDNVMQVARKAGATGGTVIKGRLADIEQFADLGKTEIDGERELLCILAPLKISAQIMEEVNKEFGLTSAANGITFAIPTEKAYKI